MTTHKSIPRAEPAGENSFSLISNKKLLALYAAMLKCRILEGRIRRLSAEKQGAAFRGREAVAAGILADLRLDDTICAPRGDLAPRFLKGVSLNALFPALASTRPGGRDALSASNALANVLPSLESFADRIEIAMRAARLGSQGKRKKISVLFLSSNEIAEDVWKQSLQSAAAAHLPILFVCHGGAQTTNLAQQALRCGLPGIAVDEEDVVAIYRVASEAIAHARRGNGPTLIECRRWKLEGTRSRGGNAVRAMETYLMGKDLFSRKFKIEVISQFGRELDEVMIQTGA